MTDHDLLRWVAEELLGWKPVADCDYVWRDANHYPHNRRELESWYGIGFVVEAMEKRGWYIQFYHSPDGWDANFGKIDEEGDGPWWGAMKAVYDLDQPWLAVFHAARKTVEYDRPPDL